MKPIFLLGFAGTGKTTLGTALQKAVPHWCFVDLDQYIEENAGMAIRDIFATRGEQYFRDLETASLEHLCARPDMDGPRRLVVGCGGGTPCFARNMDTMLAKGVTVWLDASDERLFQRLSVARAQRPLIARLDDDALLRYIAEAKLQRNPHYSRACLRFDSSHLDSEAEIAASVDSFIKMMAQYDDENEQSHAS